MHRALLESLLENKIEVTGKPPNKIINEKNKRVG